MPKISIILAVYNVSDYIKECLNSLLSQTLPDIQIICVDDCSTDDSIEILWKYAQKDNRFEVFSLNEHSGPGVARNEGLKHVKGEFITIVDPDDWVLPNYLNNLYKKAVETDADLIDTNYSTFRKGKFIPSTHKSIAFKIKKCIYNWVDLEEHMFSKLSSCGILYRSSLIFDNDIHFGDYKIGEDHIFVLKSQILANKIAFLNKNEYIYRLRKGSITRSFQEQFFALNVIQDVGKLLRETGLHEKVLEHYNKYLISVCLACNEALLPELRVNYNNKLKEVLDKNIYEKYICEIKNSKKISFSKWIFSITNKTYENKEAYKIIRILGYEIKLHKIY